MNTQIPQAQNGEEAGYVALAVVGELINLLANKQVIGASEITTMLVHVVDRLNTQPNHASKRAAALLASQMKIKE